MYLNRMLSTFQHNKTYTMKAEVYMFFYFYCLEIDNGEKMGGEDNELIQKIKYTPLNEG